MKAARSRCGLRTALCAALVVVTTMNVTADHGKIDQVELSNGDRVTCEIIGLDRGKLTIKSDAMGTLSVEWPKVQRVISPVRFDVELSSGRHLLGPLEAPAAGQLHVANGAGGNGTVVALLDVVRMAPIEPGFWNKVDGSVDAGFSFTQADHRTQWTLSSQLSRRAEKFLTRVTASSLISIDESNDNQSRDTVTTSVQRFLSNRWFAAVIGQFDQNEELGLRFRTVAGGGVGRYIVQSNRSQLALLGGAGYTAESFVDDPVSNRAEGVGGIRWDWFTFGDAATDLATTATGYYDLSTGSRYRLELSSQFRHKIFKDFSWNVTLAESFDSDPPEDQKRNDYSVTASLGWTF